MGWTCPKCGRTFQRQNQGHYCGKAPQTIDEYILQQPQSRQESLRKIKQAIVEVLPDAEERISWSMPTFWHKHQIIQFAAFKNHIGFYPGEEAVLHFQEQLKDYKTHKGTIHLLYSQPLPLDLLKSIALWCYEMNHR